MDVTGIIDEVVVELKKVSGVESIVLGGSRARGTHTDASDVDLGIYYHPTNPLDLKKLEQIATSMDDEHRSDLITEIGGWGPWINGGGWLTIKGQAIDLLYRDLYQVTRVILEAIDGKIDIAYQPGHPQGFVSYIYLSEVALCQPLWDPHGTIKHLKGRIESYPPHLKERIIKTFWWEADFSLKNAEKSIKTGDVAYAAGCCYRSVACLLQTLFAINGQYWMNEKGALAIAEGFQLSPPHLRERVESAFADLNRSPEAISDAIQVLYKVLEDCKSIIP